MPSKKDKVKKMEEVASRVKGVDFEEILKIMASIMDSYGDFALSMGKIQKESADRFKALMEISDITPTVLEAFTEKASPEQIKFVMQIFIKLPIVLGKVNRLMDLEADDKIALGEELKELADLLRELTKMREKNDS